MHLYSLLNYSVMLLSSAMSPWHTSPLSDLPFCILQFNKI